MGLTGLELRFILYFYLFFMRCSLVHIFLVRFRYLAGPTYAVFLKEHLFIFTVSLCVSELGRMEGVKV